jgi:hypothetical protein
VGQIIRNPVHKGQMRDSDGEFVRACRPIVSAAVFRRAGERLDKYKKRGPQNMSGQAMLTSVLFCDCGSPMYRSTSARTRVYYRCAGKVTGTSCRMVRLATVDARVNAIMSANVTPIFKLTLVPGRNYDDELDLNQAQIRALDSDADDYDERHAALRAERARLRALDTIPDRWEERPTGETWGSLWEALRASQRGRWLRDQGFAVTVTSERVSVAQGDREASVLL